jgi:SLT domain-containing protein
VDGASNTVDRIVNFFSGDDEDEPSVGVSGHAHANGGIASVPSVFGEAGAEMAIPLTNEREGRAQQLAAYVTNTFNMSGNETSSLSLSSALNSREWAYNSSKMSALQRRMGR